MEKKRTQFFVTNENLFKMLMWVIRQLSSDLLIFRSKYHIAQYGSVCSNHTFKRIKTKSLHIFTFFLYKKAFYSTALMLHAFTYTLWQLFHFSWLGLYCSTDENKNNITKTYKYVLFFKICHHDIKLQLWTNISFTSMWSPRPFPNQKLEGNQVGY